jgi:Cu-Zn family superoxide dismutase
MPKLSATLLLPVLLLPACTQTSPAQSASSPAVTAALTAADGAPRGTATFVTKGGTTELRLEVANLPAGQHGAHIHTVGRCDTPDFASAGAHLNPQGKMHGRDNPQGAHLGDLPNIVVGADGKGSLTVPLSEAWAAIEPQLFDADGAAIVIHASADDYRTDPSGNSGGRIACGVLTRG